MPKLVTYAPQGTPEIEGVTPRYLKKEFVSIQNALKSLQAAVLANQLTLSMATSYISIDRNAVTQVVPSGTTKVQLNHKALDPNSAFDATTNFRYQPLVAGKYAVNGSVGWAANPGAVETACILRKNGADHRVGVDQTSAGFFVLTVNAIVDMNGTSDYLELFVFQGSAGNLTVDGSVSRTFMTAQRIGA